MVVGGEAGWGGDGEGWAGQAAPLLGLQRASHTSLLASSRLA